MYFVDLTVCMHVCVHAYMCICDCLPLCIYITASNCKAHGIDACNCHIFCQNLVHEGAFQPWKDPSCLGVLPQRTPDNFPPILMAVSQDCKASASDRVQL